jgi:hypothetical protein
MQSKCSSVGEWINKMWYICTMEYYSFRKRNESISFTRKWMELEIIMLSDISQTKKDKHHMYLHM